ncbi:MAG: HAD family hydrolase [Bryobacteraceae bacterium]
MNPALVFDMDGVLVDVGESYRETIQQTVAHFTGRRVSREEIQQWKNRGGWNDDWKLSTAMIRAAGAAVEYDEVVDRFQKLFHGNGTDGLMLRERWIAREGLLERLAGRFRLCVFTGRLRWEAELTLRRFGAEPLFDRIVGAGEVERHKPAPDGLLLIDGAVWYVGDTVDDARSARAAGVAFIGIAPPSSETAALLAADGAVAVLPDINRLEEAVGA